MNSGNAMLIPPDDGVKSIAVPGIEKPMLIAGLPFGVIVKVPNSEMSPSIICSMSFVNVSIGLSKDSIEAVQSLIAREELATAEIA